MLTAGTVRRSKTGRERAAGFACAAALLAVSLVLAPACLASPASAPARAQPPASAPTLASQDTPLSIEDNPTGYAGALQVASTRIYQMGARAYSPSEGRFLTYDLCRPTQNRYAYTGGDPINRVDPTGCDWSWAGFLKFVEDPTFQNVLTGLMAVSGLAELMAARGVVCWANATKVVPAGIDFLAGAMGVALIGNYYAHFMSTKTEQWFATIDTALGVVGLGWGGVQIGSRLLRRGAARVAPIAVDALPVLGRGAEGGELELAVRVPRPPPGEGSGGGGGPKSILRGGGGGGGGAEAAVATPANALSPNADEPIESQDDVRFSGGDGAMSGRLTRAQGGATLVVTVGTGPDAPRVEFRWMGVWREETPAPNLMRILNDWGHDDRLVLLEDERDLAWRVRTETQWSRLGLPSVDSVASEASGSASRVRFDPVVQVRMLHESLSNPVD